MTWINLPEPKLQTQSRPGGPLRLLLPIGRGNYIETFFAGGVLPKLDG